MGPCAWGGCGPGGAAGVGDTPPSIGFRTYDEWWKAIGQAAGIPYNPPAPPCGCEKPAPTGAFEMPSFSWKQIGVSLILGVGIGYVLFATK